MINISNEINYKSDSGNSTFKVYIRATFITTNFNYRFTLVDKIYHLDTDLRQDDTPFSKLSTSTYNTFYCLKLLVKDLKGAASSMAESLILNIIT